MSLFYPDRMFKRIEDIPVSLFKAWEVSVVVLDVDNTLTTHNNPMPDSRAMKWLDAMAGEGLSMVILSNNGDERVSLFAQKLGLDYTARAMKPLPRGFLETARRYGVSSGEIAMVGDQIFTDILGANLFGCRSVLVEPIEFESSWPFRFKRQMEKGIIKRYRRFRKESDSV